MDQLFTIDNLVALLTLTGLEIVLGIDNVVFLAILAGKLPKQQQAAARRVGLSLAMLMRICLLLTISWVMGLTNDLFEIPSFWTSEPGDLHGVSGRDLIMLIGGLFLIGKATSESTTNSKDRTMPPLLVPLRRSARLLCRSSSSTSSSLSIR